MAHQLKEVGDAYWLSALAAHGNDMTFALYVRFDAGLPFRWIGAS